MKKILLVIASTFFCLSSHASNVEKIQFANAGDMSLGLMLGVPYHYANMPYVSADAMWGIKDGFVNTKTFGQNGAIDLGAYIGFCHYGDKVYTGIDDRKWRSWELPLLVRSAFHWEFVKNLDAYLGFQGGVAICHYRNIVGNEVDKEGWANPIFGNYLGAKWMFTQSFGVKAEFSTDWLFISHHPIHDSLDPHHYYWGRTSGFNVPYFSAGVTFNF